MFGREEYLPIDYVLGLDRSKVGGDWIAETSRKMIEMYSKVKKASNEDRCEEKKEMKNWK